MILYVCSQGRIRSRTAEVVTLLGGMPARSAGIDSSAMVPLNPELLRAADVVVGMEARHVEAVCLFDDAPGHVLQLDIPDVYDPFEDRLIDLLYEALTRHGLTAHAEALARGRQSPALAMLRPTPLGSTSSLTSLEVPGRLW